MRLRNAGRQCAHMAYTWTWCTARASNKTGGAKRGLKEKKKKKLLDKSNALFPFLLLRYLVISAIAPLCREG